MFCFCLSQVLKISQLPVLTGKNSAEVTLGLSNYMLKIQVIGNASCLRSPCPHLFSYLRKAHCNGLIAVAVHSGLCSLDGQIFNSFCFQCSLLQMKSTFLLMIQNLLRELCVSGLTVCQISTSVFEFFLNVSPIVPSCFSHYSLPGEPCNIPLPLLCDQDNAASSDTASSQPCGVSHGPLASLQAHSHLDLCVTLHHSRAMRAGSCLILFPS